ncbi:putative dfg5 protein [Coniochaeta ligniaria NRRL 30616]|uniref:Mannan endo-1,6-alpha-mannosidase n=1 Tax=Coniochaeta ligniaria NRRL 30616 TaxID=1408157 RepID=A0A1J7JCY5_9PEZI|nr:putative dfg5 protein [Coniochaeta ligniaria NRRL 30616]
MRYSILYVAATCATCLGTGLDVDLTSTDSIKAAAKIVASNLMSYYQGNEPGQTPGILPGPPPAGPYYWWEGGALWGTLVDYWHYTNDTTYNNVTESSLIFQAGSPENSYMPPNWTASLGNDDQGFWGMSAMLAAENNFENPPSTDPQWLALAQAVFNTQAARWDNQNCNGGMRWQIPLSNNGYDYKNTIANGIFFNLGARLARYTGNDTYAQWAEKTYNWTQAVGYIDSEYNIFDGGHVEHNCTDINPQQFSYIAAIFTQGTAHMYNYKKTNGSTLWAERVTGLTNRTLNLFFPNGVAVEIDCELAETQQCTTDMLSFKGYSHRFLAQTTQMAPIVHDRIMAVLKTSAQGAVKSCNADGTCGFRWTNGSYDGVTGAGQEMNALGALLSMLVDEPGVTHPVTNTTGGTSQGNPDAGSDPNVYQAASPVTQGDRAGAGILTAVLLVGMVTMMVWMSSAGNEGSRGSRGIMRTS